MSEQKKYLDLDGLSHFWDKAKEYQNNKIDQSYNPTSENAQSGKALFEALGGYVPTTRKIAGIDLKDDVTVDEMQTALGIGNINTALENIIAIQEALINGNYINGITLVDEETDKKYRLYLLNEKVTLEEVEQ